jgi:hypothetical protein
MKIQVDTNIDSDLFASMSTRCRPSSSLTLILAVLVLHSNKMITSTHACFNALAITKEAMRILPCDLPYTCPDYNCLSNYDGEGAEIAQCGTTEAYCAIDGAFNGKLHGGTCAVLSVASSYKLATATIVKMFSLKFSLTESIQWTNVQSEFVGDSCSMTLLTH